MGRKNRFQVEDRAKEGLGDFDDWRNMRYRIVDSTTSRIVAEETTVHAAREEAKMWNSGIYRVEGE